MHNITKKIRPKKSWRIFGILKGGKITITTIMIMVQTKSQRMAQKSRSLKKKKDYALPVLYLSKIKTPQKFERKKTYIRTKCKLILYIFRSFLKPVFWDLIFLRSFKFGIPIPSVNSFAHLSKKFFYLLWKKKKLTSHKLLPVSLSNWPMSDKLLLQIGSFIRLDTRWAISFESHLCPSSL